MSATNYFKVRGRFFFFDERFRSSVEKAFADALAASGGSESASIVLWEHLRASGPWDACRVVGETPSFSDGMFS